MTDITITIDREDQEAVAFVCSGDQWNFMGQQADPQEVQEYLESLLSVAVEELRMRQ